MPAYMKLILLLFSSSAMNFDQTLNSADLSLSLIVYCLMVRLASLKHTVAATGP